MLFFYLEGDIKEDKAAKAAQLSLRNTAPFLKH
jgi:hypothetical protein